VTQQQNRFHLGHASSRSHNSSPASHDEAFLISTPSGLEFVRFREEAAEAPFAVVRPDGKNDKGVEPVLKKRPASESLTLRAVSRR
jgi:hypothetical protein